MALPKFSSTSVQDPVMVLLPKKDLNDFVEKLREKFVVYGPIRKKREFIFDEIKDPSEMELDYVSTILPPKKVLHQPFETLFSFQEDQTVSNLEPPEQKQLLFGIHPCDVHAIGILDKAYSQEYEDPYYMAKRQNTLIAALNCTSPGKDCFCSSMGTGPGLREGYDILLTDLGDNYLVEAGSDEGKKIVQGTGLPIAPRVTMVEKNAKINEARKKFSKRMLTHDLHDLLEDNFRHPIWEELMEECLACGSCTMVCPTCFCYNVVDKIDLSLKSGKRQREWDSCMLLEYAQVALDHNFRKDRDARIKQRIYHKLVYYEPQFGTLGCVGCGRCIHTCVKKIDITEIIDQIRGE